MTQLPKTLDAKGRTIELKLLTASDMEAVGRFAEAMPAHDLLFLGRDIKHPKVRAAWADALTDGRLSSVVGWEGAEIAGTSAVVRDALGWSPHVAEIRLLVSPAARGTGLGRALLAESVALALAGGAEKLIARMTPDQTGAIAMFEENGFRGEAMLRNHVKDADGQSHDLLMYSMEPGRESEWQRAYGFADE